MSIYGGGITNNPTGAKVVSVNGAVVTLDTAIALPGNATTAVLFQFDQPYSMVNNIVTVAANLLANNYLKIQLKEATVQENHGSDRWIGTS